MAAGSFQPSASRVGGGAWGQGDTRSPHAPYSFHRPPNSHQLAAFEQSKDLEYYALFWEQRCRKTGVILNTARYNYDRGLIDALLVVSSPNGVNYVWPEEATKDLPPNLPYLAVPWQSGRMASKTSLALLDQLIRFRGLAVLSMSASALKTAVGWRYVEKFLAKRRALVCADESDWLANWSAQTQKMLALGRRPGAVMRRICCGTPVDESPIDIFYQAQFLSPAIFGTRIEPFRDRYSQYEEEEVTDAATGRTYTQRRRAWNGRTGTAYDVFVGYRNLDELGERMAGWSSRLLRRDLSAAPEPTYRSVYFELTPRQRAVYGRLRDEYVAELATGELTVARVLTRMLRLQMIARNYFPPPTTGEPCPACAATPGRLDGDDCPACAGLAVVVTRAPLERIDLDRNPAVEALTAELARTAGPVVVWCLFRQDAADAAAALAAAGRRAARYDGTVPVEARRAAYAGFRAGEHDLVATLGSGITRGHDLTAADAMIFYSNTFSLRTRRQAQDRAESLDRTYSTGIVDLIAAGTRDVDVVNALREKRLTSDLILRDPVTSWI